MSNAMWYPEGNKRTGVFMKIALALTLLFISTVTWAQSAAPQESATALSSEPPAQESITIDKSTDLIDKNLSITLFSLGGVTDRQFRSADPSAEFFDNFISFNYKINRDFRISARPAFAYSTAGKNVYGDTVTNAIRTRDFSFVAKVSNLFEDSLSTSFELANQFRLYLPTSDYSKDTGMIARLRYELEGRYSLARFTTFRYYAKPSYFFQRSTVYLDNANPKFPNSVKTTPKIDLEHGGELSVGLNKMFAVKPNFEIQEKWSNSSVAESKDEYRSTMIRTGVGLEIRASRQMNFTVGIDSTRDLIAVNKAPETAYTLMTNVALF